LFFHGATAAIGPGPPHYQGFMITRRHTTFGRIPLDEGSSRSRDLYLVPHTTLTTDRHPWPRQDSNPQSRRANDRKPTHPPNAAGIGIPHSKHAASLLQILGRLFMKLNSIYSENNKKPISVGKMQSWWFT